MPESDRSLALLDDYFPNVSRMTRFRISRSKNFPRPVIVRNKKYYWSDELAAWAETCRSNKGREAAEADA